MLDKAFEALKTFEWGVDPKILDPIDDAIVATHGDAEGRRQLETRLVAVLSSDVPHAAKGAVCRALRKMGTAHSVPALSILLLDKDLSHMARYALQAIPAQEATAALLDALEKAPSEIKIGIASSLGARATDVPVAALTRLLADKDPSVARAGALALGELATSEAGQVLATTQPSDDATKTAVADSLLKCAEELLAAGNKVEAKATYERILGSNPPKAAMAAAKQGLAASF
ncbi:MAG: HEAT repeat domain-containing protein [Verrucomicrobia bacterium]|nr:HEAT repeat domain-containing protein [Verrucomicrobiota bacterium]